MSAQNYGGFTPSLPSIDVRFSRPEHIEHFLEAWRRPGTVPALPTEGPLRAELMAIGTILEHELRHFHDHLLCFESLQASWIRRQMLLNGMPAITCILKSDEHDIVPFPLLDWAGLNERDRGRRSSELEDLFPVGARRFWKPLTLQTSVNMPQSLIIRRQLSPREKHKFTQQALHAVRAYEAALDPLRHGLDTTQLEQGRFTPRFAHEFSALSTQVTAVAKTYGMSEAVEFMGLIASDGSTYNRFFWRMLHLFGSKGAYGDFDPSAVDFPKMQAVAFWVMTGCPDDGSKAGPATRLSTLVTAAEDDWVSVFPAGMDTLDLLDHFDSRVGCVPYRTSLGLTQTHLQSQCDASLQVLRSIPGTKESHTRGAEIFDSVLRCRADLIAAVGADPERYIDPGNWMLDLNAWPQCPVHLRFSTARMYVHKDDLRWCGSDAMFNVTSNIAGADGENHAGDVYMPSFFRGTVNVPLEPVIATQRLMLMLDLLFEPEQVSVVDDNAIRGFVRENYGKQLVRLI